MDPLTAIAALAPLLVEAGKAAVSRWLAPDAFKPATVEQWLQMRAADVDLFKAMNDAGGAAPSYPWVEAVVRLQRPAVVAVTLGAWAWAHATSSADTAAVDQFASCVGFYLFGDRTLFYSKRALAAATVKP